jgi:Tfp pilus assembly protein PilF
MRWVGEVMSDRVAACALKICLIVFCGFVIAFGQSSQPDNAAKEAIARAQAAYLKKDFALAKRELESALAIKKDLAEPHLLLGMIARREGKIDTAIKSVREAIKYQPNYPEAHFVMGGLYFEKRDWKRAEEEANLALSQDAKLANVYALLGDIALAREQYEPAVKFFEQASTQSPPNGEVTNEARIKMEAVKNYVEFQANKKNKDFQAPKIAVRGPIPRLGTPRQSEVKLAGIVNEQGRFTPILVLYASDQEAEEIYLKYVTGIQFTPAKRNGAPVLIWQWMEFKTSVGVQVVR